MFPQDYKSSGAGEAKRAKRSDENTNVIEGGKKYLGGEAEKHVMY